MAGKMKFDNEYFNRLGHSPKVTALVTRKADQVAAAARATAPVNTGAYRAGIRVKVVRRARRNVALVVAEDPKSMFIESETGNLARALNSVKSSG